MNVAVGVTADIALAFVAVGVVFVLLRSFREGQNRGAKKADASAR